MSGRVSVTFETGVLGEALRQAASVAPTSGKDVTMYAGVLIEVNVAEKTARVRSTDSETFYSTWIPCEIQVLAGVPSDMVWRLPSNAFSSIINSLPSGHGKMVTLMPEGKTQLQVRSGKMQAQFNMIDPDGYPNWNPFQGEKLEKIPGLRDAMKRVEWCVMRGSSGTPPLSGILVGPELVAATDRVRVAIVEIDTPFKADHCVPLVVLNTIMAGSKIEPDLGISEDGGRWLAEFDEDTQYSSSLYTAKFPPLRKMFDSKDHTHAIQFQKDEFLDMARRALQMSTAKRTSKLDLFIGQGSLSVYCLDTDMGFLGDMIDLPAGQADHEKPTKIRVIPDNFLDMIASGDDLITMHYNAGLQYVDVDRGGPEHRLRFELGQNYQVWCMPLTGKART